MLALRGLRLALVLLVPLLAGCATRGPDLWTKPDTPPEQIAHDDYDCDVRSSRLTSDPVDRGIFGQRIYEKCMASRGYTRK